ncbi:hypothetical protein AGDE_14027 [Angomonas deanei]|uniref:Uncharacterized protein n=1 Tax=Angomonas deanei TaxID=59799 RepID=A0A7G2CV41_9TRYP|nr:hypothetical protein AGDE_14027 [Angomonas deanei]CAD2222951.1 hypothetical protein, conserved [Angomonas deanei]|eukprot:EPY21529.1 hypothetical protein AGDE_14027 [Angomonas deanei]
MLRPCCRPGPAALGFWQAADSRNAPRRTLRCSFPPPFLRRRRGEQTLWRLASSLFRVGNVRSCPLNAVPPNDLAFFRRSRSSVVGGPPADCFFFRTGECALVAPLAGPRAGVFSAVSIRRANPGRVGVRPVLGERRPW